MKNAKSFTKVLSAMAVSMMILSACKGGDTKTATTPKKVDQAAFPIKVTNNKK